MAENTPTPTAAGAAEESAATTTTANDQASNGTPSNEDQTQQQRQQQSERDSEQQQQDVKRLHELTAAAKLQYSLKNYTAAADLFSSATELQALLRGEMAPDNAELLYAYGRCLYQVAVSRSDVLGGKVGEEAAGTAGAGGDAERGGGKGKRGKKRGRDGAVDNGSGSGKGKERKIDELKEGQEGNAAAAAAASSSSKSALDSLPEVEGGEKLFQFKGDENFTMSDEEEEEEDDDDDDGGDEGDANGEGADRDEDADADEDDFANAYEILDLARILVKRQRDELAAAAAAAAAASSDFTSQSQVKTQTQQEQGSSKSPLRQLDERLADIYDLQAEISLENERFTDAVADCRAALQLKKELYPPQSNLVAEAHFKLSLALEFASVTTETTKATNDASAEVNEGESSKRDEKQQQQQQQVDGKMREEAAQEMAAAIESCKLRIAEEEEKKKTKREGLVGSKTDDTAEEQALAERKEREIADVKEMIEDMEQRVCYDDDCCYFF